MFRNIQSINFKIIWKYVRLTRFGAYVNMVRILVSFYELFLGILDRTYFKLLASVIMINGMQNHN